MLNIQVGQKWKTRDGSTVRVTLDRDAGPLPMPNSARWRWALSNSQMCDDDGRCSHFGNDHKDDLIELIWENEQ